MMTDEEFRNRRRQMYLSFTSYMATAKAKKISIKNQDDDYWRDGYLTENGRRTDRMLAAAYRQELFQLQYTAGEDLTILAESLTDIVFTYEQYSEELSKNSDEDYRPPFILDDMIDSYVNYINLLSSAILLHREDLIPRIYGLIEGTDFDGVDLVIEELLIPFLPNRPDIDEWLWDKPYGRLLEAKYAEKPEDRVKGLKKYVKGWYPSMKGRAMFWGGHEKIEPDFSPYEGYWAMCAAAFSYLYDIDDRSYRDEVVYPKDLADYARSKPRRTVEEAARLVPQELRRCEGGKPCPVAGQWFTPAKLDSRRLFAQGETMPIFETDYGNTVWYWAADLQN